ncbi:MAG: hypothetical protein KGH55_00775 [Nanoarchaeota archaeon]|nr:hypothetical protein [Nanoarchaeota archaeon]
MEKKSPRTIRIILPIAIIVVLVVIGFIVFNPHKNVTSNVVSGTSSLPSSAVKFSDTPYYPYAYLISSDTLSSEAQQALAGFDLNKTTNANGTMTYTLTAIAAGYVNQSYTLNSGQSLYFIERSLGDDADNNDYNLGDDFAIVVDSSGDIAPNQ